MRVRVPFGGQFDSAKPGDRMSPGEVLALAMAEGAHAEDRSTVDTPWGTMRTETREKGVLLVGLPPPDVVAPRIMLAMAAARLGIDQKRIEGSGMPMQTLELGQRLLVVPVAEAEDVREASAEADVSQVPGANADAAVVYTRTQRTPYVKLLGRLVGEADPMTAVALAAVHLVTQGGVRATYPRTRVVGELVGHEDERCEITLELEQAGHGPKVKGLLAGGRVEAIT